MFIVDDPLLALILRFVINTDGASSANEEFLKRQLKAIKRYLTQFPTQEQGPKVMHWIEQHAERYRDDWHRRSISKNTVYLRCEDCPLAVLDAAKHCEIHEQWLYLLRQYTAGQISSTDYVENALDLLRQHKEDLKLRLAKLCVGTGQDESLKDKQKDKRKKGKKNKKRSR